MLQWFFGLVLCFTNNEGGVTGLENIFALTLVTKYIHIHVPGVYLSQNVLFMHSDLADFQHTIFVFLHASHSPAVLAAGKIFVFSCFVRMIHRGCTYLFNFVYHTVPTFNPFPNDKFWTILNRKHLQTTVLRLMKMLENFLKGLKSL